MDYKKQKFYPLKMLWYGNLKINNNFLKKMITMIHPNSVYLNSDLINLLTKKQNN